MHTPHATCLLYQAATESDCCAFPAEPGALGFSSKFQGLSSKEPGISSKPAAVLHTF